MSSNFRDPLRTLWVIIFLKYVTFWTAFALPVRADAGWYVRPGPPGRMPALALDLAEGSLLNLFFTVSSRAWSLPLPTQPRIRGRFEDYYIVLRMRQWLFMHFGQEDRRCDPDNSGVERAWAVGQTGLGLSFVWIISWLCVTWGKTGNLSELLFLNV